ncbi:5-oxoprolinase subunit PxpB [Halobacillus locisalis]|uniref:5-oxoprolinase subunit PxpB n=1 Tax=Halobacillus locisalis TaxID=220753 RepID=A0A838CXU0_9BACI|nr:5-oxoprolinase subunit PxpB [Halobacillus locisalis]MBA2176416.1 5-oxoprolinase subunit PxpB [Halobacillus locisalis]
MDVTYSPLGDQAITIKFGTSIDLDVHQKVKQFASYIDQHSIEWMVEYIPTFTTVTMYYDPMKILRKSTDPETLPYEWVRQRIEEWLKDLTSTTTGTPRTITIPVCYGGEFGPDLHAVATYNQLEEQDVINLHLQGDYLVYMIGFAPGFPYIGGMDETISMPRKEEPRQSIPEGSVGIAGKQTGVYSIETPGGWQLIGRTPLRLFRPEESPPSLLQAGDRIVFTSITEEEFYTLKEDPSC